MLRRLLLIALVAAATTMPVGAESPAFTVIEDLWQSLAEGRNGSPRVDRPMRGADPVQIVAVTAPSAAPTSVPTPSVFAAETLNLMLLGTSLLVAARWLRRLPRRA